MNNKKKNKPIPSSMCFEIHQSFYGYFKYFSLDNNFGFFFSFDYFPDLKKKNRLTAKVPADQSSQQRFSDWSIGNALWNFASRLWMLALWRSRLSNSGNFQNLKKNIQIISSLSTLLFPTLFYFSWLSN